jgi:hypothetical protein
MEKSANKRWKESGSTLSFKEWIDRENKKKEPEGNFIPFISEPIDTYSITSSTIDSVLKQQQDYIVKTAGYRTAENANKNTVLGLDKKVLVFSTLLIVGSLSYYFYQKLKQKK